MPKRELHTKKDNDQDRVPDFVPLAYCKAVATEKQSEKWLTVTVRLNASRVVTCYFTQLVKGS